MSNISVIGSKDGPAVDERELDLFIAGRGLSPTLTTASVVSLGDSRTAYDGGVVTVLGTETTIYKASRGYVSQALVEMRQRLKFIKNGGVGGDTVAQMLARVDPLLTLKPGWVIGFGFANSLSANASAASIITDLSAIFDKIDKAGARVVWGTDWIETARTAAQKAVGFQVNEWLRSLVGTRRNFVLVDYAAVMSDPATGAPLAAYATDGLHQTPAGARVMGHELAAALTPLTPKSDRLIASNADTTNLIPNGMLLGGASYATGWGWNGTGSQGVATKVARTDGYPGEWQQIAVTNQTDYIFRSRNLANVPNSWVIGDTVYAECEFETDAAGWAATEFNLGVNLTGGAAGSVNRSADLIKINGTANDARIASGIFRTPPIKITPGTTIVDVAITLKGSGTYRIAKAALKRV